jgi:P27 family predicted phage terminase small subunit
MSRGRPPKPLERIVATQRDATHKANGTAIARIEVPPDRTVPAPVPSITGRGLEEWQKVWTAGFWLKRDQDYHWVEMLAQAYADIEGFRKRVGADGLVVRGYNGQVAAHPLIKEIRACEETIRKCLSVLGFSPTDRARLNIAEAKFQNELQKMIDGALDR